MIDTAFIIATCGTIAVHSLIGIIISAVALLLLLLAGVGMCGINDLKANDSISSLWQPFADCGRWGWVFVIIPVAMIGRYCSYIFRVSFCVWFALSYLV